MGDPEGIGPEVLVAALRDARLRKACSALVIGSRETLARRGWRPSLAPLLDPGAPCRARPGRPTAEGGRASFEAVRLAVRLAARRLVAGIVTGPISKEAWAAAGVGHPDHTEYLKAATGAREVAMMLLNGALRAVLVTRHMPLKEVPRRLTRRAVIEAASLAEKSLREGLGLRAPRLGLCALNPHAGEGGLLGLEEARVLAPAARALRDAGTRIEGPLAADAAWGLQSSGRFDALVALYHDQALIPLKVRWPYRVVNWTLGLPLVRTSPGHGVAFDIAGKRRADAGAFIQAALLAARLAAPVLSLAPPVVGLAAAQEVSAGAASVAPAEKPAPPAAKAVPSVTDIVDRANKVLRGDSSHGALKMTVVTPDWTRELEIEGWNQGREKAFIVIHSPPKDKGNTTLRRKNEMWLWLAKVERVVKVPPTMMHSSWQGSDFTYEDIVKADSIVKDYDHKILERKRFPDRETLKIEGLPKPDAPVVWGRVLFWVGLYDDGAALPEREEDYSERGELIRVITLSEVGLMSGRRVPTRLECEPKRKPGQKTVIKYSKIDFDVSLPDSFFSLGRLQRSGR